MICPPPSQLLDTPGVIPQAQSDQRAALKLAICNDIGIKAYTDSQAAGALLYELQQQKVVYEKLLTHYFSTYGFNGLGLDPTTFVLDFADFHFQGNIQQCA